MRCNCGQTNMICPVHPPMGAPTNTCVMAADFNDPMELISTKELDDLRERLRQREAELEHAVMCMDRSCKRCNAIVTERGERS